MYILLYSNKNQDLHGHCRIFTETYTFISIFYIYRNLHICMHIFKYLQKPTHLYVRTHIFTETYTFLCTFSNIYRNLHLYAHSHIFTATYTFICTYIYRNIHNCMHILIYLRKPTVILMKVKTKHTIL